MDVMVLLLEERLPTDSRVRPICVPRNAAIKPYTRVVIAGYGFTGAGAMLQFDLIVPGYNLPLELSYPVA